MNSFPGLGRTLRHRSHPRQRRGLWPPWPPGPGGPPPVLTASIPVRTARRQHNQISAAWAMPGGGWDGGLPCFPLRYSHSSSEVSLTMLCPETVDQRSRRFRVWTGSVAERPENNRQEADPHALSSLLPVATIDILAQLPPRASFRMGQIRRTAPYDIISLRARFHNVHGHSIWKQHEKANLRRNSSGSRYGRATR